MAFETEISNMITLGNALASFMTPAFITGAQAYNLVRKENWGAERQLTFTKEGFLVAETVAESTNYTYSANSELTDTSVQVTSKKGIVGSKLSVEVMRFGGAGASNERVMKLLGIAMGRLFDADLKALFPSVSSAVTATSTFNKNLVIDARYNIVAGTKGAFSGKLVAMVDYKAVMEVQKELTDTTASVFANERNLGLLGLPQTATGFAGRMLDVDFYQTDGLPLANTNSDDVGCMWDPDLCFVAGVDEQGMQNTSLEPRAENGVTREFLAWFFFKVAELNDAAGCRILSDT